MAEEKLLLNNEIDDETTKNLEHLIYKNYFIDSNSIKEIKYHTRHITDFERTYDYKENETEEINCLYDVILKNKDKITLSEIEEINKGSRIYDSEIETMSTCTNSYCENTILYTTSIFNSKIVNSKLQLSTIQDSTVFNSNLAFTNIKNSIIFKCDKVKQEKNTYETGVFNKIFIENKEYTKKEFKKWLKDNWKELYLKGNLNLTKEELKEELEEKKKFIQLVFGEKEEYFKIKIEAEKEVKEELKRKEKEAKKIKNKMNKFKEIKNLLKLMIASISMANTYIGLHL